MDLEEQFYNNSKEVLNISFEDWKKYTKGSIYYPLYRDNELYAIIMAKKNQVHLCIVSKKIGLNKYLFSFWKDVVSDLLKKYKEVYSLVSTDKSHIGHKIAKIGKFKLETNVMFGNLSFSKYVIKDEYVWK